jgi:hypothetical protein
VGALNRELLLIKFANYSQNEQAMIAMQTLKDINPMYLNGGDQHGLIARKEKSAALEQQTSEYQKNSCRCEGQKRQSTVMMHMERVV